MSGNEILTSLVVNLKGNLERQSKRNTAAIKQFSRGASGSLNVVDQKLKKTTSMYSTLGKRVALLAAGIKAVRAATGVIDFDADMAQLQTDGKLSAKDVPRVKKKLFDVSNQPDIRIDHGLLGQAYGEIVAQTGMAKEAEDNLRTIGLLMRATGTEAKTAGAMIAIAFKQGITQPQKVLSVLDAQLKQSLVGSVPLRDLAREGKAFLAPAASAISPGERTIIDTNAVAQITIDAVKSSAETSTAVARLISQLQDKGIQKTLRGAGVTVTEPNSLQLRLLSESIPEIYDAAKGDTGVLKKLLGDEAIKVFQGFALPGNREQLKHLANVKADGSLLKENAKINASTAKAALQSIKNKGLKLSDTVFSQPTKYIANDFDKSEAWRGTLSEKNAGLELLDIATGYSAYKSLFDNAINKVINSDLVKALSVPNTPEGIQQFNALVENDAAKKSTIELKIESDKPVDVQTIKSDQFNISVDTGVVAP